jgi:hypothetical protein
VSASLLHCLAVIDRVYDMSADLDASIQSMAASVPRHVSLDVSEV